MLDLFFHWISGHLLTPWGLAAAITAAVTAGFFLAPTQTLAVIVNWRTWAIVGVIAAFLAYHDLKVKNDALVAQNTTLSVKVDAQTGAITAIQAKLNSNQRNTVQTTRLKDVARKAPVGKKEDAVLDQINSDDGGKAVVAAPAPAAPAATGGSRVDQLLDTLTGKPVAGPGKPHP